jgi:hypothetical protein
MMQQCLPIRILRLQIEDYQAQMIFLNIQMHTPLACIGCTYREKIPPLAFRSQLPSQEGIFLYN